MTDKITVRAEAERLFAFFKASGAMAIDADLLQPADTLLDLYGEDIRARAYVTQDPNRGEMMLRPDFTVPVVQTHMEHGGEPARYTYLGEVFRKQQADSGRATEYLQVGYELFDREDPERADAEVFSLFNEVLSPLGLRPATGDIGILKAAVETLTTTERRKGALMRHIWRPRRFRALLDRFTGRVDMDAARKALLDRVAKDGAEAVVQSGGPEIGLRSREDVLARIAHLQADAAEPPISRSEAEVLDVILSLRETLPNAHQHLRDITVDLPGMAASVDRMARRMDALAAAGITVEDLPFEASFGRTTLEYYDGFVFGFVAEGRPDLPPVATGGRYDALTRVLGRGQEIPAVGGVIRPELVQQLREGLA
ncbi:ATP phosphoribosyltransferase regulatory subunit [Nioella sediminis]|jgi:ATP phosphoribosyltransferase regulatory subunit|uniref:ATP phosphoribosyltransferase regulatory subunit n=1 Tax=Nioella sediminis TaxID=1912092 RepID=UPI0008FD4F19|nr:ATP phosphoribosyltransferase regulatory subunit [Nioella sediminis]TBX28937.1 ATP phosphoribosyltransferase [Roseovarius sp. JS7-11]